MRRLAALAVALCVAASAAAGGTFARPAPRAAVVTILDNAFHRGIDRPTVRVRLGGVVTWRWAGRESHQVTVVRGPQRFRSQTRNRGTFSVRLRRAGTYRIVCSIHAPGMRMALAVR